MNFKLYIIIFSVFISCNNISNNEVNPKVIAYYTGNGETINEFDLSGVDQIIYSFLHLKITVPNHRKLSYQFIGFSHKFVSSIWDKN